MDRPLDLSLARACLGNLLMAKKRASVKRMMANWSTMSVVAMASLRLGLGFWIEGERERGGDLQSGG